MNIINRRPLKVLTIGIALICAIFAAVVIGPSIKMPTRIPPNAPPPANTRAAAVTETALSFSTSDGEVLRATLHVPKGADRRLPGMVLVHGAGPGLRTKYRIEANAFARAGIVTLTYDKRAKGYSLFHRSYSRLADDALTAAALLRSRPEVDPSEVGIWGFSEGGWVAPLAASRDSRIAFLVLVGANADSPLQQEAWADESRLRYLGVRGSLIGASCRSLYRLINGLGMFPEPYYQPAAALRRLKIPVLAMWGARDRDTPPVESATGFQDQLDLAGNRHYTLRTIAGAEHSLRTTITGYDASADLAPGYLSLVRSWVADVAAGHAPATTISGVGDQATPTTPVPPLRWYESVGMQAAALLMMLIAFAGFAVVTAWRRLRRRRGPSAPWSARILALAGPLAILGGLGYLGYQQATKGTALGPLAFGRTLPWLALQATAVVAATALIIFAIRRIRKIDQPDRIRTWLVLVAGLVFIPWAIYWGLLRP